MLDLASSILGTAARLNGGIDMDVLSEILRAVKLQGAIFFNAEFSAPWCLRSAPTSENAPKLLPGLVPGSIHVIVFHLLTQGRAYARMPNGERVELTAGDIVIFPHGDSHFLGNGLPEKPVDSMNTFASHVAEGLKVARYGGGGEMTRFVCGYMACDPRLIDVLLAGFPQMVKVNVSKEPSGPWLETSIKFSVEQQSASSGGSDLVLTKLSEVLFVETLRAYIRSIPEGDTGWLAGARDPVIGKALALLHREPERPWTIAVLAKQVGLSRTGLAERFRHFLGDSPMAYLAQWRLKLGAELLQSTQESVAEVAAKVGYGSEAAFNRAFKREFDCPPAQFRRHYKTQTA